MGKSLKPLKTLAGGLAGRFIGSNNRYEGDWALGHLYDEVYKEPEAFVSVPLIGPRESWAELSPLVTSLSASFLEQLHDGLRRESFSDDVVVAARIDVRFIEDPELTIPHLARCRVDAFITDFYGRAYTQSRADKVIPHHLFTAA